MNEIYEKEIPAMFVPNVFSFATEGRMLRYGSIRIPIDLWGPWRDDDNQDEGELRHVRASVESLLRPGVVLDILQNFTVFATDKKHRRIKVICRYQQYETTNNRADRNTFWAFGADEDYGGYMSRYSFQDSIRDKATLPLHFEAPAVKLKIDQTAIDEAYQPITGDLSEQDRDDLAKRAAKMAVLVKNPERVRAVVEHIVQHYRTKVEPNGFKAQVVCFDRECCVLYKKAKALDFDETAVQRVVSNIEELRQALPVHVQKCLSFFPGVDRSVGGYEGLLAAQQCLPDNAKRDKFASEHSLLGRIWEALSPDPCLNRSHAS